MEITRKSFISGAAVGLAGLTLLPRNAVAAPAKATETGAGWLRTAVGETFTARSAQGGFVTLRLEKVDELSSDATVEQFRLVFSCGDERRLAEGTWRLVSSTGRRAGDVFLQPAGADAAGVPLYRADFCLLTRLAPSAPLP